MRDRLTSEAFRGGNQVLIEIGSNSVKYVICKIRENASLEYLVDKNEITALGESLASSGELSETAMTRTAESIDRFLSELRDYDRKEILTVGTMALRSASNSQLFEERLRELGLDLMILSGEEEAELSFMGVASNLLFSDKKVLLFDTGGGSTEFVEILNGKGIKNTSLDIGAVSLMENFWGTSHAVDEDLQRASTWIEDQLCKNFSRQVFTSLIGTGGNVITMLSVREGMPIWKVKNFSENVLKKEEIKRQISLYRGLSVEEIVDIPGMEAKRAPIILAGSIIVKSIMDHFSMSELSVSIKGTRHGIIQVLSESAYKR